MAEISPQIQEKPKEEVESDVHNVVMKIQRAPEIYKEYEEKPTKGEVLLWYLYELCSYFVHTLLIPIVFPLIISQTVPKPTELRNYRGSKCNQTEMQLYEELINRAIKLGHLHFSPLEWTSVSWITGLILSAPILGLVSIHLDYGHNQQLIAASATGIGALFCLPAGFFRKSYIFPPYIAAIIIASTIASAAHARHLGLMIRGFTGPTINKRQFPDRRSFASRLSLYSTAAGCLGASIMASFTYHMIRHSDHFTSLWVVSIFSGLCWGVGMIHIFSTNRGTTSLNDDLSMSSVTRVVSIFKYPHAAGSLVGVFLSSFISMCVFGGGLLYAMGDHCVKTENILYLWLVYFMFPLLSLPLSHPLQQILKLDAEKMKLLGFVLSCVTSGFGFYYRSHIWSKYHILLFAAIQGTATGLLHAFGRALWLDCSPAGKEGAFSVWFSWARAVGACAGFALATSVPGNVGKSFGVSFCAGIVGIIVLIFGNISSFGGAKAAGHVINSEKASPVRDDLSKGKVEV
ncbi:hypothetical protein ACJIZ3_004212 [Penstemon smallii]|uniref:Uncharacterized protein n=1 Tax=Penstemon smallii TaxID=265156 RepID=A0ABD3S1I0_9LAMI